MQNDQTKKRILINGGPDYLVIDLDDRARYLKVLQEIDTKTLEFKGRAKGNVTGSDEDNALGREYAGYLRGRIDDLFGVGTSVKLFGDVYSPSMIAQFFKQITPYLGDNRNMPAKANFPHAKGRPRRHGKK